MDNSNQFDEEKNVEVLPKSSPTNQKLLIESREQILVQNSDKLVPQLQASKHDLFSSITKTGK